jgi:hypothetical protein
MRRIKIKGNCRHNKLLYGSDNDDTDDEEEEGNNALQLSLWLWLVVELVDGILPSLVVFVFEMVIDVDCCIAIWVGTYYNMIIHQ